MTSIPPNATETATPSATLLQRLDARHVVYDHRRSHTEPLLWAADAVCWAAGASGDWRRRIEAMLSVVDIGP